MKQIQLIEVALFSMTFAIVALMLGLNCLQGVAGIKMLGILGCGYGLTSDDSYVKIGGTVLFVLFLGLLSAPILAVMKKSLSGRNSKDSY